MHIEFKIKNTLSELSTIHRRIDVMQSETGLSQAVTHDLKLILEEVVTNIIKYGYSDDRHHYIDVSATRADRHITLQVVDDGRPFNPLTAPEPELDTPIHQRPLGGLGIYLTKELTESINYRTDEAGNVLTLKMAIEEKPDK